ncbi:MAG: redoxin domain-containing protein [Blastocatellia bacterium]
MKTIETTAAKTWIPGSLLLWGWLMLGGGLALATPAGGPVIGERPPEFELTDLDGRSHRLSEYQGRPVLLTFHSVRCPISRAYTERLRALAGDFRPPHALEMLAINASADESDEEVRTRMREAGLPFPVLRDRGGLLADSYGVARTPHVFLLDERGYLRYQGRIDNSHQPRGVTRQDLREALGDILTGKPVRVAETVAMGCPIVRTAVPATEQGGKGGRAPAPEKALPAVRLLKPEAYAPLLRESAGRVVVVNFWATWCGPCVAEFPELVRLDRELRERGVRFIGISADDPEDLQTKVIPFLRNQEASYPNFIQQVDDPQEMIDVVRKDWPGTLPATFVYDTNGRMVYTRLGIFDREVLRREIEKVLPR